MNPEVESQTAPPRFTTSLVLGLVSLGMCFMLVTGSPNAGLMILLAPLVGAVGVIFGVMEWRKGVRGPSVIAGLLLSSIAPILFVLFMLMGGFGMFASH